MLNQTKLKPGLGASYTIRPGNEVGPLFSPGPTQGFQSEQHSHHQTKL